MCSTLWRMPLALRRLSQCQRPSALSAPVATWHLRAVLAAYRKCAMDGAILTATWHRSSARWTCALLPAETWVSL